MHDLATPVLVGQYCARAACQLWQWWHHIRFPCPNGQGKKGSNQSHRPDRFQLNLFDWQSVEQKNWLVGRQIWNLIFQILLFSSFLSESCFNFWVGRWSRPNKETWLDLTKHEPEMWQFAKSLPTNYSLSFRNQHGLQRLRDVSSWLEGEHFFEGPEWRELHGAGVAGTRLLPWFSVPKDNQVVDAGGPTLPRPRAVRWNVDRHEWSLQFLLGDLYLERRHWTRQHYMLLAVQTCTNQVW